MKSFFDAAKRFTGTEEYYELCVFTNVTLPPQFCDDIRNMALESLRPNPAKIQFLAANLDPEEDVYIRHGNNIITVDDNSTAPITTNSLPLGNANGPSTCFYTALDVLANQGTISHALLIETDCFPARDGWISTLELVCRNNPSCWIIGSAYKGAAQLYPPISDHINGAAIYNVASAPFMRFVRTVLLPFHVCIVKKLPFVAYDCALCYFASTLMEYHREIHNDEKYKSDVAKENWNLRLVRAVVINTNVIVNICDADDVHISLKQVKTWFPEVALIHRK